MEELRIGVFVCRCGSNIAGFLETSEVAQYAASLPHVVMTKENAFTCSESGISEIKKGIIRDRLNRVVVAACTPRTHEPTFRAACEDAGLNPFLFEFVNIREQCSWVHREDRGEATKKAKDLVRMGVARAALLEPRQKIVAKVNVAAMVLGGGIAGMSAALSLANRGFKVSLVERQPNLGGMLKDLYAIYPTHLKADELLEAKIKAASGHPNIELLTSAQMTDLKGYIGNYTARISADGAPERAFTVGVIIVATGATVPHPDGAFGYDGQRVITQLELEGRLKQGMPLGRKVVMILCVGSRTPQRVYCSRVCCMSALKNAMLILERDPEARVHVVYRDLMCLGAQNEAYLMKAKEKGVRFIHYNLDAPPAVGPQSVKVYNELLGAELNIAADLVVLSTPMVPAEGVERTSQMLKVPLDEDKFFLEAHMKLRPLDFATDGIFVCGSAHWPSTVQESIAQGLGAAARASIPLGKGAVEVEPIVSMLVDESLCRGCGMCASLCPYNAIEIVETQAGPKAKMIEVACKGCGVCGSTCYRKAIKMNHFTDEQLTAQLRAYLLGV